MDNKLTVAEHIERHRELQRALDELIADFIDKTGKLPSRATVMELMEWSHQQTIKPDTESAPFRWATYDEGIDVDPGPRPQRR